MPSFFGFAPARRAYFGFCSRHAPRLEKRPHPFELAVEAASQRFGIQDWLIRLHQFRLLAFAERGPGAKFG